MSVIHELWPLAMPEVGTLEGAVGARMLMVGIECGVCV